MSEAQVIDRTDVPSRSTGELMLYMRQHPCPRCGKADSHTFARRDGDATTSFVGPCSGCGLAREFRFRKPPAVLAPATGGLTPDATPSSLFDRAAFAKIADDALAAVAGIDAGTTDADALSRLTGGLSLALTALVEAGKFGGAPVAGRIEELRARLAQVDGRRQQAATAAGYVVVDQAAIRAHEDWARRGRSGTGRIVARAAKLDRMALRGAKLAAIQLTEGVLDRANLSYADLADAELVRCSLAGTGLTSAQLPRAKLTGCTLTKADLRLAVMQEAVADGGDWRGVQADRGDWTGARLRGVDLRDAVLGDVVLDSAIFDDCDLREAKLARVTPAAKLLGRAHDTRFVGCDLRGVTIGGRVLARVTFERCRVGGMVGKPALEGPVRFVDCEGNSGRIDGGADLLGWK